MALDRSVAIKWQTHSVEYPETPINTEGYDSFVSESVINHLAFMRFDPNLVSDGAALRRLINLADVPRGEGQPDFTATFSYDPKI